jgi:hypothetical protein
MLIYCKTEVGDFPLLKRSKSSCGRLGTAGLIGLFLLLQFTTVSAYGQIQFVNPSFENGYIDCTIPKTPYGWLFCETGVWNCKTDTVEGARPSITVVDGEFTFGIRTEGANYNGAISQNLSCALSRFVDYEVSFWLTGSTHDLLPIIKSARAQLWLGNDTCSRDFKIFESGQLDTVWEYHTITFTPDTDYSYFHICGLPQPNVAYANVLLDAFSPIYVVNAHQIHSYTTDTLLPIGSTACLNLNAYSDTTYSRVWWEQVGVGLIDNQINAGTYCTDTNTTYIIHMLGQDSTCAGYLPSSDTVRVRFYDPNGITQPETATLLKIYPNPAANYITIAAEVKGTLTLHDDLGRLVVTKLIERGNASLSIEDLPSGVYCYRFTSSNNIVQYGKIVKQ